MLIKISYKASSYFSRLLNATADGWASKPSTHNTFSFRPRTSLELQENGFFFRFSSCFFFFVCENKKDVAENKSFVLFHFFMPESFLLSSLIDHFAVLFPVSCFYDRASFDTELLHRVQKNKISVKTVRKCNHVAQHYITLSLSYEITAVYFTSMTWVSNKGFPTDLWRFTQCCSQKVN